MQAPSKDYLNRIEPEAERRLVTTREELGAALRSEQGLRGALVRDLVLDNAAVHYLSIYHDLDFSGCTLQDVVFRDGYVNQPDFTGAKLSFVLFDRCKVLWADFTGAVLDNVVLNCDLNHSRFDEATLTHTRFRGELHDCSFKGATLDGCRLDEARFSHVQGDGVVMKDIPANELNNLQGMLPNYAVMYTKDMLSVGWYALPIQVWLGLSQADLGKMNAYGDLLSWWTLNSDTILDRIRKDPAV